GGLFVSGTGLHDRVCPLVRPTAIARSQRQERPVTVGAGPVEQVPETRGRRKGARSGTLLAGIGACAGCAMHVRSERSPWAGARWAGLALLSVVLAGAASSPGTPGGPDGGSSGSDGGGGGSDSGVPQQPCGPMDVAFVIDVTGSMGGAINNVKAAIPQLMDQIVAASAGDYRAELVTVRDAIDVGVQFAAGNRTAIQNAVQNLFAGGGGNAPEMTDEALRTTINALGPGPHQTGTALPFRSSALKIIVLITDALPAGFDDFYTPGVDDVNANQRALDAAAARIKISAVFVPTQGIDPQIVAIMQNYATQTGGIYLQTQPDGTGTADAIREVISACGGGPPPDGGTPDAGGGGGNGDVHFRTFGGQAYDFQKAGCLTLAESRTSGSNVALQIDTQPWVNNRNTSITKRMALSIPDGRA